MASITYTYGYASMSVNSSGTIDYSDGIVNVTVTESSADGVLTIGESVTFSASGGANSYVYNGSAVYQGVDQYGNPVFVFGTETRILSNSVVGSYETSGAYNTTATTIPICFMSGTLITTPNGTTNVESLSIGDEVITTEGV
ncbi:MAG: Hint domain-containing protein, partial [Sulfuricurvum sp.]